LRHAPWDNHYLAPGTSNSLLAGILILIGGLIALGHGAIYLFFGIMASMGGVLGIMRRKWELVVVGAVFSMLSVGTLLLSSILGLVGLIPAALSRGDFDQRPGGPGGKKVFTVPAASAPSVP